MEQLEQPVEGAIPIGGASPNASSPVVWGMTVSNVPGVVLWSKAAIEATDGEGAGKDDLLRERGGEREWW